jgi:hypothetical protein
MESCPHRVQGLVQAINMHVLNSETMETDVKRTTVTNFTAG